MTDRYGQDQVFAEIRQKYNIPTKGGPEWKQASKDAGRRLGILWSAYMDSCIETGLPCSIAQFINDTQVLIRLQAVEDADERIFGVWLEIDSDPEAD